MFATGGGKGAYRIAERLDFDCAQRDSKFLVGFSDVTILQMALWKQGVGAQRIPMGFPTTLDAEHGILTVNRLRSI